MVDVEIDRYIDEHSVSNLNYSLSTLPRLKPADRDNLKLPSHFFFKVIFRRFATLLTLLLLSADIKSYIYCSFIRRTPFIVTYTKVPSYFARREAPTTDIFDYRACVTATS